MELPYLLFEFKESDLPNFIDFWCRYYVQYPKTEGLYTVPMGFEQFTAEDILGLFKWKNGMPLSNRKLSVINKILAHLDLINYLKLNWDIKRFDSTFRRMPAIWQIFLMHIIRPEEFPIFDQHVYRASVFITERVIRKVPGSEKEKIEYYHNNYKPFFHSLTDLGIPPRRIDNALWTFGQFLNTKYARHPI